MVSCPRCPNSRIESDSASGNAYCTECGVVVEENTIVSEITFGESSSGAAIVQGSFVPTDATGARISGPFRNQSSESSREQTIKKGRQRVMALANAMRLPERLAERGVRYFTLAVANNFTRGRRSQYVVATCLYIVCRHEKTSHMLIDFADLLQINVFVLGSTFLKFVKALHINMPLIDPSLYITRFAALLDFGEDTHKVASDATRLVARMKRDWIDLGRRPAGICGACLIIAARMNNYRRSMAEIVHVVKVAESTVQQRLSDFSQTASASLTVEDFANVWLEKTENPPAFDREKTKSVRQQQTKKRKRKGKRIDDNGNAVDSDDSDASLEEEEEAAVRTLATMREVGEQDGVFKMPYPIDNTDQAQDGDTIPLDPMLAELTDYTSTNPHITMTNEQELEDELSHVLDSSDLQTLESEELARRADQHTEEAIDESLADVDDDEIESVLLDARSVEIKTQVWMQNNFDYLAMQEKKRLKAETDKRHGIKTTTKKKKKKTNARDASQVPQSPAESARQLMEQKVSKRVNRAAFDNLFDN